MACPYLATRIYNNRSNIELKRFDDRYGPINAVDARELPPPPKHEKRKSDGFPINPCYGDLTESDIRPQDEIIQNLKGIYNGHSGDNEAGPIVKFPKNKGGYRCKYMLGEVPKEWYF